MREHFVARTVHPELRGRHAGRRRRKLQSRSLGAGRACTRRDPATAHQVEPEARSGGTRFATGETRTRYAACTKAGTGSRSGTNACTDTSARRASGTRERTSAGEHACTSCACGSGDNTINGHRAATGCHDDTSTCTVGNPGTSDNTRGSGNTEANGFCVITEDDL
jgi:hypothetical protein